MKMKRWLCAFLTLVLLLSSVPVVMATEAAPSEVEQVIALLEEIDTLQQIQNKRSSYKTSKGHYDVGTTDASIAADHEAKRAAYEAYVSEMFAKRSAAQNAYEALSASQKQQIPQDLVAKLDNNLPTVFNAQTLPVTPSEDEYHFEAVRGGLGYGYEVSNYMVSGEIPQTFILVDTADGKTSWTPDGLYEPGVSNYEVLYCCDVKTPMSYNIDYKRMNLEDSDYFSDASADHIRGILTNCYPYVSLEEMKQRLKAAGMKAEFVDGITRSDAISAAQMAVWTYANTISEEANYGYFASVGITANTGVYFTPLHDHSNEVWEWLPQSRRRSYDARAEYRVNMLAHFLCRLPAVSAGENTTLAAQMEVTRALVEPNGDGTYQVGVYVTLPSGGTESDRMQVTMTSYQVGADGSKTARSKDYRTVGGDTRITLFVTAKPGDEIQVTLDGTQTAPSGVYFYEARGGRDASQSLVGVSMGRTRVHDEESFTFDEIGEMGLRIYKTVKDTKRPISDIVFSIYHVQPEPGEDVGAVPSLTDINRFVKPENLVGSVTTDNTGYAAITLPEGIYLVQEEPNPKVKAPVDPFYVYIPMQYNNKLPDGTVEIETVNIVSVYPKNEPPDVPPPPPPPPPAQVMGQFQINKFDAQNTDLKLAGAQFGVYTAPMEGDTNTVTVTVGGVDYTLVPVMVDGQHLVLETDSNGYALSPELECTTYLLVELQSPRGYLPLEEPVSVTVQPNTVQDITTVEIPNDRGLLMPETGGIGTTVFTVTGLALVVVALVLLILKKQYQYCE